MALSPPPQCHPDGQLHMAWPHGSITHTRFMRFIHVSAIARRTAHTSCMQVRALARLIASDAVKIAVYIAKTVSRGGTDEADVS